MKRRQLESYAVEMQDGVVVFFEAVRVHIWRGRLLFRVGLRLVGAVERGEWARFVVGLTPGDLRQND